MFSAVSSVSHHDPELTFNHSFIEQPSSGWVTDSFETDDEGEAIYCEPPREGKIVIFLISISFCNFYSVVMAAAMGFALAVLFSCYCELP